MARSQNRYLKGETSANVAGGSHVNELQFDDAVNVHGLVLSMSVESEVMEANSNGFWILYAFPGDAILTSAFPTSFPDLDDEDLQAYIWGIGTWMASNQTPWVHEFRPKTSRNLTRRGRLVLQMFVNGTLPILTANRMNSIISVFASP